MERENLGEAVPHVCEGLQIAQARLCRLLTYLINMVLEYIPGSRIMCKVMTTLKTQVVNVLIGLQTQVQL